MNSMLLGLITGIVFGIILQRSEVVRFDRQIGLLLLKDMTVLKFMLSSIAVGMIGVYILKDTGTAQLSVKPLVLGGIAAGGLLFGIGWAIVGYCPATSMAALGEGRIDALAGILGMIFGAGAFAHAYPILKKNVLSWGDYRKLTLPEVLGVSAWFVIPVFVAGIVFLLRYIDGRNRFFSGS